ncbi:hypothetical protein HMPREF2533_03648 [Bacteroides fragilis]|uniref:Uncharacterized protein n=1 Tax=Bacteroides fragilis (strain ATCC 25285 / DSM 2151 / CCUG 4856 / JCM 11019 / LMG 10263 / NCTC 9343 / Onslow / VPI 2553 / EN-2) TaxID=272559 RepID=Q5L997_BACFN|nr:hypothetical protein M106_3674 [Bacteroides fragilis str. 1009-4-F \
MLRKSEKNLQLNLINDACLLQKKFLPSKDGTRRGVIQKKKYKKHKKKEKPILKLIDPPFLLVEEIHLSMKKTIDKKRYSERSFC